MKKIAQLLDFQRFQQNPKLGALIGDVERRYASEVNDDDLEMVSAAGEDTIPTVRPEPLLGRHARPSGEERETW